MRRIVVAVAVSLPALGGALAATAETDLRTGLGDDGDVLDPTLSRFYTTRILFASICDKLFDIDEKDNIVPQLALGSGTSADSRRRPSPRWCRR